MEKKKMIDKDKEILFEILSQIYDNIFDEYNNEHLENFCGI